MAKTLNAKILVHSLIDEMENGRVLEGLPEVNDTEYDATMKIHENAISLSYKEVGEGGTVFYDVLCRKKQVTVSRTGAINSCMVFSEGEIRSSAYEIPPYRFDMTLKTKRLKNTLNESGGVIDILYEMQVGGADKRCRMKMTVEVKH